MTQTTVSDADFAKLQQMARLTLSDAEKATIHAQLDEALHAIEVFDELDLTGVPPLTHPTGLENVMREDVVTPSFSQEEALQNAPMSHGGYIMVPGVFEEQA
jgi:aspartyl-tRNA(Asn)/glutamyl-tRNA(Gln) amidotransferase subunit C